MVKKRILTLKSKLGFGKYENITIDDIIKLQKDDYLRWVYYNYEFIDFMPEILDSIKISNEFRLVKPSKNPEMLVEINSTINKTRKFVYLDNDDAKEKRRKIKNTFKSKNKFLSKEFLLRKNHGHF
jgi:ABC-type xylose transport system substrate-binding protein